MSLSCVTQSRLAVPRPEYPLDTPIRAQPRAPAVLRLADIAGGTLLVDIRYEFTIAQAGANRAEPLFRAVTRSYKCRLLDRFERELLVYHWQPGPRFAGPDHPHLHVSASLRASTSAVEERAIDLDKLHLPTGQVPLASVVRSLITEFGVEPQRRDWARLLDETEAGEFAVARALA